MTGAAIDKLGAAFVVNKRALFPALPERIVDFWPRVAPMPAISSAVLGVKMQRARGLRAKIRYGQHRCVRNMRIAWLEPSWRQKVARGGLGAKLRCGRNRCVQKTCELCGCILSISVVAVLPYVFAPFCLAILKHAILQGVLLCLFGPFSA